MFADKINISDRVSNQLPEFIRDEDQQLVNFLFEYYKSQEKTGRAYNVLNNLLEYDSSSSTISFKNSVVKIDSEIVIPENYIFQISSRETALASSNPAHIYLALITPWEHVLIVRVMVI